MPPVVAVFFVDDGLVVVREHLAEGFECLILQLQPVHEEEHALDVAGAEEELDDGGGSERLAGAGGHLQQEAALSRIDMALDIVWMAFF